MNVARVASVHELQLEAPIEFTGLRRQRALEIDYELIQQRFVCAIVKEPSEVLIILRAGRIEGDSTVDPTGNLKAWRRSGRRRNRFGFAGHSDRGETKSERENETVFHK